MAILRISLFITVIAVYAQAKSNEGPMVAFICNKPAMYYTDKGWLEDRETDCIQDPVKILEYCRAKFPELEVTNVVKANEKETIGNWCGFDKSKCHKHNIHDVTPYRCLVGAFQSDALLVPEHCLFDHKHGDQCAAYDLWNTTAITACSERDMLLESFAILQPCGVNVFNGVEFVCCPKRGPLSTTGIPTTTSTTTTTTSSSSLFSSTAFPKLVEIPLVKVEPETTEEDFFGHYLQKSFDERYINEHGYFMKAKTDLNKHHHERVTKMMKEWASARQRVQDISDVDPKGAEKLNHEITARFQKTYEALEEEGLAEKKQLTALHQQRVQSELNDKKRHAMEHYMDVLTTSDADAAYILKALKHYIKTEQKDRMHTVNHYKHVADTDPKEASSYRQQTLDHLKIIDQRVQQAIDMLNRVPALEQKIRQQIDAYQKTFHEIDVAISELLVDQVDIPVTEEKKADTVVSSEEQKSSEKEAEKKVVELPTPTKIEAKDDTDGDYEEYYDDDEYDTSEDEDDEEDYDNEEEKEKEPEVKVEGKPSDAAPIVDGTQLKPTEFDDEVDENEHDLMPEVLPAHLSADKIEVRVQQKKSNNQPKAMNVLSHGYTLGIAVAAIAVFVILVAGIIVLRKKNAARAGANHGFVEIDQAASPEERHVANMQMNGYENPTYKYFESNA